MVFKLSFFEQTLWNETILIFNVLVSNFYSWSLVSDTCTCTSQSDVFNSTKEQFRISMNVLSVIPTCTYLNNTVIRSEMVFPLDLITQLKAKTLSLIRTWVIQTFSYPKRFLFHLELAMEQRVAILNQFKECKGTILITTNVAARSIDLGKCNQMINMEDIHMCPI